MPELSRRIAEASRQIDARWNEPRANGVARRITRTLEGRQRRARLFGPLVVVMGTAMVALVAGVSLTRDGWRGESAAADRAAPGEGTSPIAFDATDPRTLNIRGGEARAVLIDATARVTMVEASAARTRVRVSGGGARFHVRRRPAQEFQVEAGDVRVTVHGTIFSVVPQGARVHVQVTEGLVSVSWVGATRRLGPGEGGTFPPEEELAVEEAELRSDGAPVVTPAASRGAHWQALARRGEYSAAYRALGKATAAPERPQDLLLAADAARLSGHADAAIRYLREIVRRHPTDTRAPLAAFTAGKLLLDATGDPRGAGAAFEQARALAPRGALAELALARAVEAYDRAGARARAHALAAEYVRTYPRGARLDAVKAKGAIP